MIAANYSQVRANLKSYLDKTTDDFETIIVTRKQGKNVVILSEEAYNNLLENAYLTASKANYDWLLESKKQYEGAKAEPKALIED